MLGPREEEQRWARDRRGVVGMAGRGSASTQKPRRKPGPRNPKLPRTGGEVLDGRAARVGRGKKPFVGWKLNPPLVDSVRQHAGRKTFREIILARVERWSHKIFLSAVGNLVLLNVSVSSEEVKFFAVTRNECTKPFISLDLHEGCVCLFLLVLDRTERFKHIRQAFYHS